MSEEAGKNGRSSPPPTPRRRGLFGGLVLATTASTDANKNKQDGGGRAVRLSHGRFIDFVLH